MGPCASLDTNKVADSPHPVPAHKTGGPVRRYPSIEDVLQQERLRIKKKYSRLNTLQHSRTKDPALA